VSYAGYLRALSSLVSDPDLARGARAGGEGWRSEFDLTELEADRLEEMCRSPGMEVNCMLVRSNRLIPLALAFPQTFAVLGDRSRSVVDRFWSQGVRSVLYAREADAFEAFLSSEIEGGRLDLDGLESAFDADRRALMSRPAAGSRARPAAEGPAGNSSR
jgi:hypothetical protein